MKLDSSDLQYYLLYMIFAFQFPSLVIIFLEKLLWLSRISVCLIINDSPSINYSQMVFSRKDGSDL